MTKRRRSILICLLAAAILAIVASSHWHQELKLYTVTILPSLGGDVTFAEAINDLGQIVGTSSVAGGAHHPFRWDRDHGMRDLGPIGWPADINNEGRICGTARDPNGRECAFIVDPDGIKWLLDSRSTATAINNHGLVIGESCTGQISRTSTGLSHAFIWDEMHGMRSLCPPGADCSYAQGINERGQVLVFRPPRRFLLWDPNEGLLPVCSVIPGNFYGSGKINGIGRIALASRYSRGKSRLMISDDAAGWRTVLTLRGDIGVACVNDANQVVFSVDSGPPAIPLLDRLFRRRLPSTCLWDPHLGVISLDRYIPQGSPMQLVVHGLNNHGCIVGTLYSLNSKRRYGVLLEPIPERWGGKN